MWVRDPAHRESEARDVDIVRASVPPSTRARRRWWTCLTSDLDRSKAPLPSMQKENRGLWPRKGEVGGNSPTSVPSAAQTREGEHEYSAAQASTLAVGWSVPNRNVRPIKSSLPGHTIFASLPCCSVPQSQQKSGNGNTKKKKRGTAEKRGLGGEHGRFLIADHRPWPVLRPAQTNEGEFGRPALDVPRMPSSPNRGGSRHSTAPSGRESAEPKNATPPHPSILSILCSEPSKQKKDHEQPPSKIAS